MDDITEEAAAKAQEDIQTLLKFIEQNAPPPKPTRPLLAVVTHILRSGPRKGMPHKFLIKGVKNTPKPGPTEMYPTYHFKDYITGLGPMIGPLEEGETEDDRIYLPQTERETFGPYFINRAQLRAARRTPDFKKRAALRMRMEEVA